MKLNKNNYFSLEADRKYMSVSQLKSFMECEAKTLAELNGEIPKAGNNAFLEGNYLHAWNEGKLDEFKANNPQIYKYNNPEKGLMKSFSDIDKTIEYLEDDEIIMDMLEGQKEVIMTANLFDTEWKFQIDVYNPDKQRFADLKYVQDIEKKFWSNAAKMHVSFIENYKYHYQMVLYAILEQIATGRKEILEPYIVAIGKQLPPQKIILNGFLYDISKVLADAGGRLPRILKVKKGEVEPHYCGNCSYCRKVLKAQIINYKRLINKEMII